MFLVSQPTGLQFCLLPVFPSCLPVFGSVPVLIRSLSNYKLITFIVSTCQPLVICPIFVMRNIQRARALNSPIVSLIKYLIPSNRHLRVTLVCAEH